MRETDDHVYIGSPDNPRTAAIVCYITFIGWLISYFALYKDNKTSLVAFHLKQTLLLHILSFILNLFFSFVFYNKGLIMAGFFLVFILFLLWMHGIINAVNGREKKIPFVGRWAQNMFRNL